MPGAPRYDLVLILDLLDLPTGKGPETGLNPVAPGATLVANLPAFRSLRAAMM